MTPDLDVERATAPKVVEPAPVLMEIFARQEL
jgi:hypothetical protein